MTGLNARPAVASGHDMNAGHFHAFDVSAYSSEMAARASTRLDRWALARIQSTVASAPIRFMLWDGFAVPSDGTCRRDHPVQEPSSPPQLGVGSRSQFRRGLHVRRRRDPRRPAHRARSDLSRVGRSKTAALVAVAEVQHRTGCARERSPSLRPGQRVLPALARSRDGVHVRVFPDARRHARGGADREDGSRLPEAPAAARRTRDRSRLRVGLAGAVHGEALRRHRAGVQHLGRADCVRAEPGEGRGARRSRRVHRGRLPQCAWHLRRVRVGRHARARRPARLSDARPRHRPLAHGSRTWAAALHRPQPGRRRSIRGFASASFPARTRRRCAKSSNTSSSRRRCRCSTSRTCGCTTRRRWSTGASASTARPARWRRCSTTRLSARGGSIWPARRRRSRPAAMQLFQVVFARGSSNAIPWTRVSG